MPVLTRTFIRQLTTSIITTYGSEDVSIYKFSAIAPDLYRQGARTYAAPVVVKGHVRTELDEETITRIGKLNADEIFIVFSLDELETKMSPITNNFVTTLDIIKTRGVTYSVKTLHTYGAMLGGENVLGICCQEYPDSPV